MKLISNRFEIDERQTLFTQCIMNLWNTLPQEVMSTNYQMTLKRGVDNFIEDRSILPPRSEAIQLSAPEAGKTPAFHALLEWLTRNI